MGDNKEREKELIFLAKKRESERASATEGHPKHTLIHTHTCTCMQVSMGQKKAEDVS